MYKKLTDSDELIFKVLFSFIHNFSHTQRALLIGYITLKVLINIVTLLTTCMF